MSHAITKEDPQEEEKKREIKYRNLSKNHKTTLSKGQARSWSEITVYSKQICSLFSAMEVKMETCLALSHAYLQYITIFIILTYNSE